MATLTQEDQNQISATIAAVESKTAGEVVVALVGQSDDYAQIRYTTAFCMTIITAWLANHVPLGGLSEYLIPLQLPVFFIWIQATKLPALTRFLVKQVSPERARERAMRMFIERGIHNTRDQSGLLVMLSELEHQVVILGDAGIHAKVGDPGWEAYIQRIVEGLQQRQAGQAVVSVLKDLGEILATHFPAREDDTNELSDKVVVES